MAEQQDDLYILRHSTAHVMAQAVCDLWPGAKYAIGPPIADGFYYDFDLPEQLTHRRGERVRGRVPEGVERVGVVVAPRHDRDGGPVRKRSGEIHQLAVDLRGDRGPGEAGSDGGGQIPGGGPRGQLLRGSIGEGH